MNLQDKINKIDEELQAVPVKALDKLIEGLTLRTLSDVEVETLKAIILGGMCCSIKRGETNA
jgi:hypothetical protein